MIYFCVAPCAIVSDVVDLIARFVATGYRAFGLHLALHQVHDAGRCW